MTYQLNAMTVLREGPPQPAGTMFEVVKVVQRWVTTHDDFHRAGFTVIAKAGGTTMYIPVTEGSLPEVGDVVHYVSDEDPLPLDTWEDIRSSRMAQHPAGKGLGQ